MNSFYESWSQVIQWNKRNQDQRGYSISIHVILYIKIIAYENEKRGPFYAKYVKVKVDVLHTFLLLISFGKEIHETFRDNNR